MDLSKFIGVASLAAVVIPEPTSTAGGLAVLGVMGLAALAGRIA